MYYSGGVSYFLFRTMDGPCIEGIDEIRKGCINGEETLSTHAVTVGIIPLEKEKGCSGVGGEWG